MAARQVGVALFLAGLLLAVRVMFFGVRKEIGPDRIDHRRWPLALASALVVGGAMLYAAEQLTAAWLIGTVLAAAVAAALAWLLVQRSAAIPSTDPEDDPRYRFQGHVARVTSRIDGREGPESTGRIAFEFDGKRHECKARWAPEADLSDGTLARADVDAEVVIEFIDGDTAYVEPWVVVEKRL